MSADISTSDRMGWRVDESVGGDAGLKNKSGVTQFLNDLLSGCMSKINVVVILKYSFDM